MAVHMTKRGAMDNIVTYEFMCDTVNDLNNILPEYITLGSVAIVIDGFQMYIANGNKLWINLSTTPVQGGNS